MKVINFTIYDIFFALVCVHWNNTSSILNGFGWRL